tara:strand:+ start:835 stop:1071 length:237 start_codon:yes stop_codon:yes gene_type:complete
MIVYVLNGILNGTRQQLIDIFPMKINMMLFLIQIRMLEQLVPKMLNVFNLSLVKVFRSKEKLIQLKMVQLFDLLWLMV